MGGYTSTLVFHVLVGHVEAYVQAPDAIRLGRPHNYLCSVTAGGHMRIYIDRCLVAENPRGAAPIDGPRRHLYVAKSNWIRDQPFHGVVAKLRVWNAAVDCDFLPLQTESGRGERALDVP